MRGVWVADDVRAAEDALMAGLPEGTLMRRAAYALAVRSGALLKRIVGARVVLLVGSGNNGGDALYAGAFLAGRGAQVTACLLSPAKAHPGGLAALRSASGLVVEAGDDAALRLVDTAELVMDGIAGLSSRGPLRPRARELAERARLAGAVRVAVDLPSGVDCDTGAVPGEAFDADLTVTFGCLKPGLVVEPGSAYAGRVEVVDIGLGPHLPAPRARLLTDADAGALWPAPKRGDDKYSTGVVGVVAGSPAYPGAAVLSVGGALKAKSGLVRYVGTGRAADLVRSRWPEAVVTDGRPTDAGRVQAWVVGPGIGTDDRARSLIREVLATDVPVLIDADGLTLVAEAPDLVRSRVAPTLLTPHDREFERIAGPVGDDRIAAALRAAKDLEATVLLKGHSTIVASAGGEVYVNPTGTPWLATAGTGDVLSGVAGALLAADIGRALAGAAAAYLHGMAGQLAGGPLETGAPPTSVDVLDHVPAAIRAVRAAAAS